MKQKYATCKKQSKTHRLCDDKLGTAVERKQRAIDDRGEFAQLLSCREKDQKLHPNKQHKWIEDNWMGRTKELFKHVT